MKRFLIIAPIILVAGVLLACSSGSKKAVISQESATIEVSGKSSDKLTCPENLVYEAALIKEVALAKVCYSALRSTLPYELTNVVIISEDKNARTASVEVYATEYGCEYCPEEYVAKMNLIINVNGLWQVRNSEVGFQITDESKAARIQKQTFINQKALDQATIASIGLDSLRSHETIYANVSGTYGKEVWVVIRLQDSDGQIFDYVQLDFGRYAREAVEDRLYEFELLYKKGEGINPDDTGAQIIAYKLVTFKYPGVYPYQPIDVESDWVNIGLK